jgi:membrane protease YdiL (CAAX protease family)
MSNEGITIPDPLRVVVFGEDDPRVRATWRVLLAMPVLWLLTGGVLAGNVQSFIGVIPSGQSLGSGLAQSPLHGGFFLIALVVWARYLDRQPLSNYGVSVSLGWVRDFLVGFVAVVIGHGIWIGLGSLFGGRSVQISPSTPDESVLLWLLIPFVALVFHAAIQQIVFFRVILKNAAEGLHSRGINAHQAAFAGIPISVVFFVLMHGSTMPLRVFDLAVAGGIFGLLYLHTGELGLGIGAHFGAFYSGTLVFAVFQVTGSLSGLLWRIGQYGFPKVVVGYLVVLAWLLWRRRQIPIQESTARWNPL